MNDLRKLGRRGASVTLSCSDWASIVGMASVGLEELRRRWQESGASRVEVAASVADRRIIVDNLLRALACKSAWQRYAKARKEDA